MKNRYDHNIFYIFNASVVNRGSSPSPGQAEPEKPRSEKKTGDTAGAYRARPAVPMAAVASCGPIGLPVPTAGRIDEPRESPAAFRRSPAPPPCPPHTMVLPSAKNKSRG